VCAVCGAVVEAPEGFFDALARNARRQLDFTIDPRLFAVLGLCGSCDVAVGL